MHIAEKLDTLQAELAAKSSRIADLEARVSLLETENARLRKVMHEGDAMDLTGKKNPTFGRLEEGFGGNKQKPVDIAGGRVVNDAMEVGDGEGESGDKFEIMEAYGGGGGHHGSVHCDANVGLDDDDVSITPRGKERAAARVISDSESGEEDENDGGNGNREVGVASSRKRALRGVTDSESEEEDDGVGVGGHNGSVPSDANVGLDDDDVSITPRGKTPAATRVISDSESGEEDENDGRRRNQEVGVASSRKRALRGVTDSESEEEEDGEPHEMEGCSTPAPGGSARLDKCQSKRIVRPARRELEFEEPQDQEETEDGSESEEGYNTDEFIDDADCSDNPPDPAEEYSELEECDGDENLNYGEIIDRIRGKKNATNKDWKTEAEMLPTFDVDPELTLKAICAIYRQQTEDEQAERATIVHNRRGFSQIDAPRGSRVAQFLLDGDASGPLKKTAQDLSKFDREFCHKMAFRYSKQLFEIYQNKEDPYFP